MPQQLTLADRQFLIQRLRLELETTVDNKRFHKRTALAAWQSANIHDAGTQDYFNYFSSHYAAYKREKKLECKLASTIGKLKKMG
jgi:hypothetical protein